MGHLTVTERVLNLEQAQKALESRVNEAFEKHIQYDQFFEFKKSQETKLRKARQAFKKLKILRAKDKDKVSQS